MPGSWIEIKARGSAGTKDRALGLLIDAGSPGVVEEGFLAREGGEGVWEVPPGKEATTLTGYIPEGQAQGLSYLKKRLKEIGWAFTQSLYRDRDWSVKWREGFRPLRISYGKQAILVRAPWHKVKRLRGDKVILINPSMAFGTGRHPTTRMCLKALLALASEKRVPLSSFLDVGTGSGILAVAAKKLGFRKSLGIDIDRTALKVARKTARLNR